jgi:hypothetical protein
MLIRQCPSCGSRDVHRCRKRTLLEVWILPLILIRPFRCMGCYQRYYGFFFSRQAGINEAVAEKKA